VVLVAAVCSEEPREGIDFFPLTVEYQEKTYAAGRIPGGFFKREGRPTEKEILTARLIDRPIRPLFPKGMTNEVQLVAIVVSSDAENDSDVLAMLGASTALSMSDIPFDGPISALRVGRVDGKFVINPTFKELDSSDLDLVVAGNRSGVLMVEAGANEVSEETMLEAINFGQQHLQALIDLQEKVIAKCGKKKREVALYKVDEELVKKVKEVSRSRLDEINSLGTKEQREGALENLSKELIEKFVTEEAAYTDKDV
jgi:polyribonucleotide nucleotidyltransferase